MCSCNARRSDIPDWFQSVHTFARRHRDAVRTVTAVAAVLAALVGVAVYLLSPTDIDRAEADLQKARDIVAALDEESTTCQKEARGHKTRAAEFRERADENKDTTDEAWLEWHRAMADGHARLGRAKADRRDNLFHLCAEYLRLLAEAECEIIRAKDARDRGTPYKVAPRVRDLLAPILGTR